MSFPVGNADKKDDGTIAYVLRAHMWNGSLTDMLIGLKESLGAENVWILLDSTHYDYLRHLPDEIKTDNHLVVVDDGMCREMSALHKTCYHTPEASFVYLYQIICKAATAEERSLKFMWVVEYDVRCTGQWRDCLDPIDRYCDHDFLATRVDLFTKENYTWHWWGPAADWRKVSKNNDEKGWKILAQLKPPLAMCGKSFLPISRYSRRYLDVLAARLGQISAYCEVFLPSLCLQAGLKIGNLPPATTNHDQFRYGDPIITPDKVPTNEPYPRLFHPVRLATASTPFIATVK